MSLDTFSEKDRWQHSDVTSVFTSFCQAMDGFGGFEANPFLMVAVSGGADSMALCLLAHKWCQSRGGKVLAVTVDHDLRPGSAAEAVLVHNWLKAYGILHITKMWSDIKPTSAVESAARDARYHLLDEAAAEFGCLHLLLGHHADDQRETVAMRRLRDPKRQSLGQAGMAAVSYRSQTRVLRPLLRVGKAQLEAFCRTFRQDWAEDPTNASMSYERNRIRRDLSMQTDAYKESLDQDISKAQMIYGQAQISISTAMVKFVRLSPLGFAWVDRGLLAHDLAHACISRLLLCVSGSLYPSSRDSIAHALDVLADVTAATSISGCLLRPYKMGLMVMREMRLSAVYEPEHLRWDRRFCLESGEEMRFPNGQDEVVELKHWVKRHARGEYLPNSTLIRRFPVQENAVGGCLAPCLGYDRTNVRFQFSPHHGLTQTLGWLAPPEVNIMS